MKKTICCLLQVLLISKSFGQLVPARQVSSVTNISEEIIAKANQGIPFYQATLAKCYFYGRGTKINYEESVKWLKKAMDQNHWDAYGFLGMCYYYGRGVKQDYTEAARLFQIAADHGYEWSSLNLAVCYQRGHGVEKNQDKANELFLMAEQKGLFRDEKKSK